MPDPKPLIVAPPPFSDESALGYFVRLTELNGLPSLGKTWEVLGAPAESGVHPWRQLATPGWLLACAQVLTFPVGSALANGVYEHDSAVEPYFRVHDVLLPMGAYLAPRVQVCPRCLEEAGYLREDWDFAHVTACLKHQVRLVDRCPSCGTALHYWRAGVFGCGACGYDLRRAPAVEATPEECEVADWVAARAPFRFRWALGLVTEPAEHLYGLWALLATALAQYLCGVAAPARDAALRQQASMELGRTIVDGAVDGDALRERLLQRLAHIATTLRPWTAEARLPALQWGKPFLSTTMRQVLAYGKELEDVRIAVSQFHRRPPRFIDATSARRFVGVDEETWQWLCAVVPICTPPDGDGYDIDELVMACSRVAQFLHAEELDAVLGVRGATRALLRYELIQPHGVPRALAERVDQEELFRLLDRVRVAYGPEHGPPAADACNVPVDASPAAIALLLSEALRGQLASLEWRRPFGWNDFYLSPHERDAFLSRVAATDDVCPREVVAGQRAHCEGEINAAPPRQPASANRPGDSRPDLRPSRPGA